MAKKMLIDATHPEETRVVVADGKRVEEFDFETENRLRLVGNIYLAKVTRVEPSLQAAFIDYGGSRHGFLAFSEIHPDYYQIPIADRRAILAEEEAFDLMHAAESEAAGSATRRSRRRRSKTSAEAADSRDAVEADAVLAGEIPGMGVVDLDTGLNGAPSTEAGAAPELKSDDRADGQDGTEPVSKPDDFAEADVAAHEDSEDGSQSGDPMDGDDGIESIAGNDGDEDEEIRQPRKPRPRPYKIQEVIKVRQILLVQVIKEERGNKGAALTTYISLAGRYCVLMPNTARGGGISRKITSAPDRSKLKEIASNLNVPKGAGLIIRTAGAKRTKSEIKRDYEFLQRLWEQIRELTLNSIAPVQIYEEGNLIKRSIRDLYSREIDEVLVEGEAGYRTAKDFMKMIMPSHAKRVKSYQDSLRLFSRYQVEGHLSSMYSPTVQLKSGGYIVIGVTEALVAIDVNSGRATREGSVEGTALKTNLEAAEEIARQLRLRDLAGLIVIDFIDMEERRNNAAVEKRFKDRLRSDRARIQVGSISGFGLLEMSRQRQRMGLIEATTQACAACQGTGRVRSDGNLALSVLRQLEEEGTRRRHQELLLRAPVGLVNFLINQKREHVAEIEDRYGISIRIEADASLISPDYAVERFKSATRTLRQARSVISADASMMPEIDEVDEDGEVAEDPVRSSEPRSKTRRRSRRTRRGSGGGAKTAEDSTDAQQENGTEMAESAEGAAQEEPLPEARQGGKRSGGRRRSKAKKSGLVEEPTADADTVLETAEDAPETSTPAPKKKKQKRSRRRRAGRSAMKATQQSGGATADAEGDSAPEPQAIPNQEAQTEDDPPELPDRQASAAEVQEPALPAGPEEAHSSEQLAPGLDADTVSLHGQQAPQPEPVSEVQQDRGAKSKRRGWWRSRE